MVLNAPVQRLGSPVSEVADVNGDSSALAGRDVGRGLDHVAGDSGAIA
jgi:hypothetical protein